MKIYDITQEVFTSNVYPGDNSPSFKRLMEMKEGALYNFSTITMSLHNGTHLDAPWHFVNDGEKIDEVDLEKFIGQAVVVTANGNITADFIKELPTCERILFKGDCVFTLDGAEELTKWGLKLVGIESQSVAPVEDPIPVHVELLSNEVVILEGLVLGDVPDGEYFLSALPLKLGGLEGSPCRAILIQK